MIESLRGRRAVGLDTLEREVLVNLNWLPMRNTDKALIHEFDSKVCHDFMYLD